MNISREDAEALIMQARLKAGWITEAEINATAAEGEAAAEAEAEA
jgi:N utilization substance protein A